MGEGALRARAMDHLRTLCANVADRRVGSVANQMATRHFADVLARAGFTVRRDVFACTDWASGGVELLACDERFTAFASPYSLGCDATARLVAVETREELAAVDAAGAVLLLRGELAKEQVMPKEFPFYNPEHHRSLIATLEAKSPAAIVAATTSDPAMVGAQYPFPLFEDGDFDIPSVYMTREEGERLAAAGAPVRVVSHARRIQSVGTQVTGRKGREGVSRIVLVAHIDSRIGTPGANDNASGTATLLVLAELLTAYSGQLGIEIVAMNGEDYYGANGERLFVAQNAGRFQEIVLGVNLDDIAYHVGRSAYSLYDCPAMLGDVIVDTFKAYPTVVRGDAWHQGDHMLFVANQVPALAVTDEYVDRLMREITHTARDTLDIVDPGKVVSLALALRELVLALDDSLS